MAKFHLIPIVLGAAIGVGAYVVSKYLAQDEESEHIVDDSAFDDSEDTESTEDTDETEEDADEDNAEAAPDEDAPAEEPAAEPAPEEEQPVPVEEPAPAEEAPAEESAQEDDGVTIPIQSGDDVPNVNPVQDKTEPVKLTEDGKVDPTTIAKAEDFGDWEEETGCRG